MKQSIRIIIMAVFFAAVADAIVVDKVVARIGDENIMMSEFEKSAGPIIENYRKQNPSATDEEVSKRREEILEELVAKSRPQG